MKMNRPSNSFVVEGQINTKMPVSWQLQIQVRAANLVGYQKRLQTNRSVSRPSSVSRSSMVERSPLPNVSDLQCRILVR